MSVRFLTLSEVVLILEDQIRRYGGEFGVRDLFLLSSALGMPQAQYSGSYLHETIFDQAAAYAYHICQNHPFVDGNKRVGLSAALVFMELNGYEIEDPGEKLYDLMMSVAAGGAQKGDIAAVFRRLSRPEEPE